MEELLLSFTTTRYRAGLVMKTNGMKNFILSGKTMTLGGRTAGKVITHTQFKDTEKTGQVITLTGAYRCCSASSQVQYSQLLQALQSRDDLL